MAKLQKRVATAFAPAVYIILHFFATVMGIFRLGGKRKVAPIHALPNELLVEVFSHLMGSEYEFDRTYVHMAVCRRWKEVALNSTALWNNLEFSWGIQKQHLVAHLERSKDAPLRVSIGRLDSTEMIDILMAEAHRFVYLDIGGAREYLVYLMEKMSSQLFPVLEHLCLKVKRNDEESDNQDPIIIAPLPQEVLDGRIPRLRGLELVAIEPQWVALHSLRYLTLNSRNTSLSNPLPFHIFLSILRACPEMVGLHAEFLLEPEVHELYSPVHLPLLERLYVQDHCRAIEAIFQLVSFPVTARLELYPYDTPILYINSHPATTTAQDEILVKILDAILTSGITHLMLSQASGGSYLNSMSWSAALRLLSAIESIELGIDDPSLQLCQALVELGPVLPLRIIEVFALGNEEEQMVVVEPFLESFKTVLQMYSIEKPWVAI
ncbi:hypothetical protein C8F01DRAFT_1371773 [Mycena amicta]|nr:hypothetical protein C8F01DRAFT_1371773 [Mycena amicta]